VLITVGVVVYNLRPPKHAFLKPAEPCTVPPTRLQSLQQVETIPELLVVIEYPKEAEPIPVLFLDFGTERDLESPKQTELITTSFVSTPESYQESSISENEYILNGATSSFCTSL